MSKDVKASYYDAGGIECIDIVEAKLTPEEFIGYLKGTALVYLMRAAFKEDTPNSDHRKASIYTTWLNDATHGRALSVFSSDEGEE